MIIFVVVVVVVVVLFARVTMQRKKELMCELKKKIHESLFVSLFIVVLQEQRVYTSRAILFYSILRAVLHIRIANQVGEDSYCRGGIVHIRGVCSCERLVQPESSTALWRFRVSTSNSLGGLSWPQSNTHMPVSYTHLTLPTILRV